jgi:hypothetical protein
MASGYPSGYNTYVPSYDASGELAVAFSRNPRDFPLNKWLKLTTVTKNQGYFLRITAEQAARVIQSDLKDFIWPDGNDAPQFLWGNESFEFIPFLTKRYAYGFRLGYMAVNQADWQIEASHAAIAAAQAMTARAVAAVTKLGDAANYSASDTATNLGGGFWSAGTTANPIIKKTLNKAARTIQKNTLGVVGPKDLIVVISPDLAATMSESAEIHEYLKQSPFALAQVRGDVPSQNGQWGLPDTLYSYKLVIEDTVRVTRKKGAAAAPGDIDYAWDKNKAAMISRPGGLTSPEGGVSFSTFHCFVHEEMTVETKDDVDNRRRVGRVVDDFVVQAVAPASGYLITNTLS